MRATEGFPGMAIDQTQDDRELERLANLAEYEKNLINPDDEHPWWSFFDCGARDEEGTLWSVYNRWCDETQAHGWRVVRCSNSETEIREIPVGRVARQEVYPATPKRDGLTTFQLHIRDELAGLKNNDVLNVLLYHNDDMVRPKLHMWNQKTSMDPIPRPIETARPQELYAA